MKKARCIHEFHPDVVVDAILAKRNLGTKITDLVVGVGPGFTAGGRLPLRCRDEAWSLSGPVYLEGERHSKYGYSGMIGGYGLERLIKAP